MSTRMQILRLRIQEWIKFESFLINTLSCLGIWTVGRLCYQLGFHKRGFQYLCKSHSTGKVPATNYFVEGLLRDSYQATLRSDNSQPIHAIHAETIENARWSTAQQPADLHDHILNSMAITVCSPRAGAKGVIIIVFNFAFPQFLHYFDIEKISKSYHIVLEPSWSGYCTPEILCFLTAPDPVFVQAIEPYETRFIESLRSNLVPVPISANWWTDPTIFRAYPEIERDLDFVMVAAWSDYKRHPRFFAGLARAKQQGHTLRGACIGIPGRPMREIVEFAKHYGVAEQIEFREALPPEEVAKYYARAKVNVIWSRREGVNRAIIEGMFCNTPCLLPTGFNYGYHYEYINEQTGRFCSDAELPQVLIEMTQRSYPNCSQWINDHMTPQITSKVLEDHIRQACESRHETPPSEFSPKINQMGGSTYLDPQDSAKHAVDRAWILTNCRKTT